MLDVLAVAGGVILAVIGLGIAFILGWRAQSRLVLGPIVWLSKRIINRLQMRTAGQPGAYAAVIRHRGRTTGRDYATPVGAIATEDGFLIALPYGSRTSWLRNVLAAGTATLDYEGSTFAVAEPAVIPIRDVADRFSVIDQRTFRLLRTEHCLQLRRLEATAVMEIPEAA